MHAIEQFLTGEMTISEFTRLLKTDSQLRDQVRSLIPAEAVNNGNHGLWKKYSYSALKQYNFDLCDLILSRHKFDGTIADNLNIFGTLEGVYSFHSPGLNYTTRYMDAFDVYLSAVRDCFDGPEVRLIVERIVRDAISLKSKSQRVKQAKQDIAVQFHVMERNVPRWIQGPEWPMGKNSPMAFVSKKRMGEKVSYIFQDVDTDEIRIVEQYY